MVDKAERKILDMVEQGQISADEGLRLINAMQSRQELSEDGIESFEVDDTLPEEEDLLSPKRPQISEAEKARLARLKRWWVLPFGIGLLITTLGAIWMYTGYLANGFGIGFWLAWIPFLLGIFVLAISFQSSHSLWLHVRVNEKSGARNQRISISMPLPIRLTRWFLSSHGKRIPGLRDQPLDEYISILENLSPDEPFYVHVRDQDGVDSDEVEVFLG